MSRSFIVNQAICPKCGRPSGECDCQARYQALVDQITRNVLAQIANGTRVTSIGDGLMPDEVVGSNNPSGGIIIRSNPSDILRPSLDPFATGESEPFGQSIPDGIMDQSEDEEDDSPPLGQRTGPARRTGPLSSGTSNPTRVETGRSDGTRTKGNGGTRVVDVRTRPAKPHELIPEQSDLYTYGSNTNNGRGIVLNRVDVLLPSPELYSSDEVVVEVETITINNASDHLPFFSAGSYGCSGWAFGG